MSQTNTSAAVKLNKNVSAATEKTASGKKENPVLRFLKFLRHWAFKNRYYIAAFLIPALLTYLAYCIFGITPFGKYSVLCLDLNGQYVYYYEAFRDAIVGDGSLFYNWSRNLSGEFMGTIGYYAASPFMWIIVLLPEKCMLTSVMLMQLAKVGAAGVTFSYYVQKSKKVPQEKSLIFAILYAMMAYCMIQLIDPMWIDGLVYLPLIILGIEYIVDFGKRINFIIPLALMYIAHFYIGYMISIFTGIYFLYYFFLGTPQRHRTAKQMIYTCYRALSAVIMGLCLAAIMLLPMYHALQLGKFEFTDPDYSFKFQFDLIDLFRQLLINQYDSVNVWGSPEIYCGILTVVLVPLFFMNSKIQLRRKLGYAAVLVAMFFCMAIKPVDMMWHGGQSPNWLPYRYSFVVSFVLLSMAAEALVHLEGVKPSKIIGILVAYVGIYIVDYLLIGKHGFKVDTTGILRSDTDTTTYINSYTGTGAEGFMNGKAALTYTGISLAAVIVSMCLAAIYLILIYMQYGGKITFKKEKANRIFSLVMTAVMTVFCGAEVTYNAVREFKDVDDEVAYSTEKSWKNFIENGRKVTKELYNYDDSLYRSEKTFFRCINDNMAFGLRGVSHSTSVMNSDILTFLEGLGYAARTYYCRYDGNTPISDSLLGIKYVLDRDSDDSKIINKRDYKEVFKYKYKDQDNNDQTITCYKNPDALSIGYMVDNDAKMISALGNDNPFNSQNLFLSSLVGNLSVNDDGTFGEHNEYYKEFDLDEEPVLTNIEKSDYGDQICYTAQNKEDAGANTADFNFTVTEESPIYFYFRTDNEKSVNLWYGPYNEATGEYDYQWLNSYFETEHYCIMTLGTFKPGTKVSLRMTVANDYTIYRAYHFVYFDENLYHKSMKKLEKNQWDVNWNKDHHNARELEGKITAGKDQLMLTSIPYEPGWKVWVDGEKVKPEKICNALIGIPMDEGTHTVKMKFTPNGWDQGVILLIIGLVFTALLQWVDLRRRDKNAKIYAANVKYLTVQKEEEEKRLAAARQRLDARKNKNKNKK